MSLDESGHICATCDGAGQFQDSQGGWWDCVYCNSTGIVTPKEKAWWRK